MEDDMRLPKVTALIVTSTIATLACYTAASAQMGYAPRFSGMAGSSVANCPNIAWRIGGDPSGALHGIMWYADMSGLSQVDGTMSGKNIKFTLKSIMGKGPVGTVTGVEGQGATLVGEGCANGSFKPIVIDSYGGGG
jgi:hypothetical protein